VRPNFQVVRDVVASHDKIIHLFERINFSLQRLNIYTEIPLTNDFTELLGKIMAELLSVLANSTKEMTDWKMSELIHSLFPLLADYGLERFLKRLVGKTDVEDALERLDMLTKEETLMAVTKNLEVTHHVDGSVMAVKGIVHKIDDNVKAIKEAICDVNDSVEVTKRLSHDVGAGVNAIKDDIRDVDGNVKETRALTENIDDNVKATKALTEDIGDGVKVIQGVTRSVDHNVKATKYGTHRFLSVFIHVPTLFNCSQ
jgi:archaellum component FlaC